MIGHSAEPRPAAVVELVPRARTQYAVLWDGTDQAFDAVRWIAQTRWDTAVTIAGQTVAGRTVAMFLEAGTVRLASINGADGGRSLTVVTIDGTRFVVQPGMFVMVDAEGWLEPRHPDIVEADYQRVDS